VREVAEREVLQQKKRSLGSLLSLTHRWKPPGRRPRTRPSRPGWRTGCRPFARERREVVSCLSMQQQETPQTKKRELSFFSEHGLRGEAQGRRWQVWQEPKDQREAGPACPCVKAGKKQRVRERRRWPERSSSLSARAAPNRAHTHRPPFAARHRHPALSPRPKGSMPSKSKSKVTETREKKHALARRHPRMPAPVSLTAPHLSPTHSPSWTP
jgi:hypothetical protein